jgi:hypothetical protein
MRNSRVYAQNTRVNSRDNEGYAQNVGTQEPQYEANAPINTSGTMNSPNRYAIGTSNSLICYRCNKPGHPARYCPEHLQSIECFHCKERGHMARTCPNMNIRSTNGNPSTTAGPSNESVSYERRTQEGTEKGREVMIAETKEALISEKRRRDIRNSTEEGTANEASKKKGKKDLETPKIVEIFDHVKVTNKKKGSKDVIKTTNEQKTAEGSTSKATTKEDEGPKTKEPKEAVMNNDQREIIEKVSNKPRKQRENETAGTMNPGKARHTAPL